MTVRKVYGPSPRVIVGFAQGCASEPAGPLLWKRDRTDMSFGRVSLVQRVLFALQNASAPLQEDGTLQPVIAELQERVHRLERMNIGLATAQLSKHVDELRAAPASGSGAGAAWQRMA